MRLTWNTETDWMPSIAQASDGKIWVAWHSYRTGNADIFYKVYDASQVHPWSPETRLTTNPDEDSQPSIMQAEDSKIWVVWSTNRTGNYDIFCKVYDGFSWSPDDNLTTDPNVDDDTIWLSWSTNRTGNLDIFYKTSTDNGTTWSSDTSLPNPPVEDDWDPSIVETADGEIWFVWVRNDNIYYKTYNGTEWSPANPLVTNPNLDWHPSIMQASNDNIWVVWDSDRIGEQEDIYCKVYYNQTRIWSLDTRLTFNNADDLMPSIIQDINGTIWIAWASWRPSGNLDIYYKTDLSPEHLHDIAIISVTHEPNVTVAYQDLNIYIEVVPQNQGMEHEFVQVNCSANSTLIDFQTVHLSVGQLMPITFAWNTLNAIPGIYTITANASIIGENDTDIADNTFINGNVHVKIPGDVNGDGTVDIFDIGSISAHWYPSLPVGPLGYGREADINLDGAVDIVDIDIASANWGQSE